MPDFVVVFDQDVLGRTRGVLLRSQRWSAWSTAVGAGLVLVIALGTAAITGTMASWPLMVGGVVVGLILGLAARREFAALRRRRASWAVMPSEAMRLSGEGLRCHVDMAPEPVFLPWSAVAGVHLRGGRVLEILLAPGVRAATVAGLDQPGLRRALRRRRFRFVVGSLRTPPEEIDRALSAFTNGRVRAQAATSGGPRR